MTVDVHMQGRVAWVTINRPDKRNAVDPGTHLAMADLFGRLDSDPSVRVIVLSGAGDKAFCAGADIVTFLPYLAARIAEGRDPQHFCGLTQRRLGKPVIAAINGAAHGGGLELALAADIRIACDTATFALPEVTLGAIAGAGGITRLRRMIPAAVADQMILTGDAISAARAHQVGLISEVMPFGDLHHRASAIAQRIAANSPAAISVCRTLADTADLPLAKALQQERAAFRATTASGDFQTGISSFAARLTPVFPDAQE